MPELLQIGWVMTALECIVTIAQIGTLYLCYRGIASIKPEYIDHIDRELSEISFAAEADNKYRRKRLNPEHPIYGIQDMSLSTAYHSKQEKELRSLANTNLLDARERVIGDVTTLCLILIASVVATTALLFLFLMIQHGVSGSTDLVARNWSERLLIVTNTMLQGLLFDFIESFKVPIIDYPRASGFTLLNLNIFLMRLATNLLFIASAYNAYVLIVKYRQLKRRHRSSASGPDAPRGVVSVIASHVGGKISRTFKRSA